MPNLSTNQTKYRQPPLYSHTSDNRPHGGLSTSIHPAYRDASSAVPERKYGSTLAEQRGAPRYDLSSRAASISSNSGTGSGDWTSSDTPMTQPFTQRNGRKALRDTSIRYPLPCDIAEIHRQTLRTILLCQVFGSPICCPKFRKKPPKKVLEVACGSGFWSSMCHQHFSKRGYPSVSFTGIDVAPLAPDLSNGKDNMRWRFVQHDLRRMPLPFDDGEFDFLMIKDCSMVTPEFDNFPQLLMDEYLRILRPDGILEVWDGDHVIRMLLPPPPPQTRKDEEDEENEHADAAGIYTLTPHTTLAAPHNEFLVEYNNWVTKALETRRIAPMPCTYVRPSLLQEADGLAEVDSRRLAIPFGEVRWEREGVGGTVNNDSFGSTISKGKSREVVGQKLLNAGQLAIRQTALTTFVQMISSLEPLLREASGKGQDEWDRWMTNLMNSLVKQKETSYGECLEVGAWWARRTNS